MNLKKLIRSIFFSNRVVIRPGGLNNLSFNDMFHFPNFINVNKVSNLCQIMHNCGTDKAMYSGQSKHNYTPIYNAFFKKLRYNNLSLFELGIGTSNPNIEANMGPNGTPGASLKAWKNYFEKGDVFGADIDRSILFKEERIKTFYCDQTSPESIRLMWSDKSLQSEEFDIIIDDGLHTFDANKCFLENSLHKLKDSGLYIVEDVVRTELSKWFTFLNDSKINNISFKYMVLIIPNAYNIHDNNLIIIKKK